MDDVINVSGHRIGTAEVEGALTQHPRCAEAAVVPVEHPIKGQGIYAFVTLMVVRATSAHLPFGKHMQRDLDKEIGMQTSRQSEFQYIGERAACPVMQ